MPAFPLFIDLNGKKVLVFGGGEVALRKVHTLLSFRPSVEICADHVCEGIRQLIDGKAVKEARTVLNFDGEEVPEILNAFMVICATDNEVFNHKIAKRCHEMYIWVNSATSAADCTFIFPSVTVRGDIVCGMTSSGSAPVLTKKIRTVIDEAVPEWYGELSRRLIYVRLMVKERLASQTMRAKVISRLADYGLEHEGIIPDDVIQTEIQKANEVL